MTLSYMFIFAGIDICLIVVFVLLCYWVKSGKSNFGPFSFVILGMLIGMLSGFLVFFNLDTIKGWNPYGWWFLACFITTIVSGILSLIIYTNLKKRSD